MMANSGPARGVVYDAPMASVFTMIINGDLPGHFVWRDDQSVVFLSINPIADGHALVVPIREVDQWTDLTEDECTHLMAVAKRIGDAQKVEITPERVGLMIAGFEVPHTHLHVVPMNSMAQLDFAHANPNPDQSQLDEHLASLRAALDEAGHSSTVSLR